MPPIPSLTPRLIVADADAAIGFYQSALGARLVERYADGSGTVVHAALDLGGPILALAEPDPEGHNRAPGSLGGTPVILNLLVEDVDAMVAAFLAQGGEAVIPLADRFYGHREGRFRDPFGHLWILSAIVEALTPAEIEARMTGSG